MRSASRDSYAWNPRASQYGHEPVANAVGQSLPGIGVTEALQAGVILVGV